jgi:AcrR family transcriptional regulator
MGDPAPKAELVEVDDRRRRPPLVTRDQVVQAAYELVADEGPDGLSMRKLANRLHVSLPTVYTAISSREALVADLQFRLVGEMAAAFAADPQLASAEDPLERLLVSLLSWAGEHAPLADFLLAEHPSLALATQALSTAPSELGELVLGELAPGRAAPSPRDAQAWIAYGLTQLRAVLWLNRLDRAQLAPDEEWARIGATNLRSGIRALAGLAPTAT